MTASASQRHFFPFQLLLAYGLTALRVFPIRLSNGQIQLVEERGPIPSFSSSSSSSSSSSTSLWDGSPAAYYQCNEGDQWSWLLNTGGGR